MSLTAARLSDIVTLIAAFSDDQLMRFHVLDKQISEDEFDRVLDEAVVQRLGEQSLTHVGDIIRWSADDLSRFGLGGDNLQRLGDHLRKYGLEFRADVADWDRYRRMIGDADFSLPWSLGDVEPFELVDHICDRLTQAYRNSPARRLGPFGRRNGTAPQP